MRAETLNYRTERLKWVTQPRLFVRFYYVPTATSTQEYAFTRDFASGPVLSAATEKLNVLRQVRGNTQSVDPLAGTSSIGTLSLECVDVNGDVLRQVSDPAQALNADITDVATSLVVVGDGSGYPTKGTLIIDNENIAYTSYTVGASTTTFNGLTRAARGTAAASHTAGALVRNGEQIRRGTRVTLFLGYAPLAEADYGPGAGYIKMEVTRLDSADGGLTWIIQASDIQRFFKRNVFDGATSDAPVTLGPEHPLTIALKVLTSTGVGSNGPYDVLPASQGAAVPQTLVAADVIEFVRDSVLPGVQMSFREVEPADAKEFVEAQIFRPLNLVPFITQTGRYGAAYMRQPLFARSGCSAACVVGTV